jgi:hypothetical protein
MQKDVPEKAGPANTAETQEGTNYRAPAGMRVGPAVQRKPWDLGSEQRNLGRPLNLELAEVVVEVLVHQGGPFYWGEGAEEEVGMAGADGGPAGDEAVD